MRRHVTSGAAGRGLRNRRGAIVVMTGIFIVALMVIAAISVDASRIFAAKNELQTASDAAALAAAVQLLDGSSGATDTARAYALRNRVENNVLNAARLDVAYGVWMPSADTFVVGGNPIDAVRVTVRHELPLSLARVFGDSTVTLSSSAIAWMAAPVRDARCATPIALPYGRLLEVLGYPAWTNADLTADDIRRLRERGARDTVFFHYGHRQESSTDPDIDDNDEYFPVDIDSTWTRGDPTTNDRPELSGSDFRSYVNGTRCSRRVIPGDTIRSEPGNKAPGFRDGIADLCTAQGGAFVGAQCIRNGAVAGVPVKVLFWYQGPSWQSNSRALLTVRMLGAFVVTRVEDPNLTATDSRAKLYGYFNVRRDFGTVSTTATPLLRPVLVR